MAGFCFFHSGLPNTMFTSNATLHSASGGARDAPAPFSVACAGGDASSSARRSVLRAVRLVADRLRSRSGCGCSLSLRELAGALNGLTALSGVIGFWGGNLSFSNVHGRYMERAFHGFAKLAVFLS